jgi:hypothetical protein
MSARKLYRKPHTEPHPWEVPAHPWEKVDDEVDWGSECSGSDFEEDISPGSEMVNFLFNLFMTGTLTAQQFCISMHWATLSGVTAATEYAYPPDKPTGHYSRHLQKFIGTSSDRDLFYNLDVPGYHKLELRRTTHVVPVMSPHELLGNAMADPSYLEEVCKFVADADLPAAYHEHPVVKRAQEEGEVAVPLALYLDAVPYSQTDGVLGIWIECVCTARSWLCCVLRRRHVCRCGCRGWCSYFPIFQWLQWSIMCISTGIFPTSRHDEAEWKTSDRARQGRGGTRLPARGAVIYVKGDWSEYSHTLGLPLWSDGLRPCFCCAGCGEDLYVAHGCSTNGLRWPLNDSGEYDRACRQCEFRVRVTAENKEFVSDRLRYDKRKNDGSHGRALTQNVDLLGLRANDRLEPSPTLPDVSKFEDLITPAFVTFWRSSSETSARHRNPLFQNPDVTGITLMSLTIDLLHAFYLGVLQKWCALAVWFLFESHIFGNIGTADEILQRSVSVFRSQLINFYPEYEAAHPGKTLTRVSDFTVKMVGSKADPKCKTKGAETFGVALFLVGCLAKFLNYLGADCNRLHLAGDALLKMVEIWTRSGRSMDQASRQVLVYKHNLPLALVFNIDPLAIRQIWPHLYVAPDLPRTSPMLNHKCYVEDYVLQPIGGL